MRHRLRHLPEKADQCLTCACLNSENLAARELLLVTNSVTVRGVLAALFIAGLAEHDPIVTLAREAIHEQRDWCDRNGFFRPTECLRKSPHILPMAGGDGLIIHEEAEG